MSRWISSALCTVFLVAVLFCLPFWGIRDYAPAPASIVSDTTVSNVRIVNRERKQVPPAARNEKVSAIPAVPAKPAETIPVPEPEEVPAEQPERIEQIEQAEKTEQAEESSADAPEEPFEQAAATYKSYVLGRIASKKTYPYAARSNGFEGKVRARAVINPDGTLADAVILTPCEYELLNTACLAAIKKAAPFKKMSAGMGALTVSFVMDFSLK